MALTYSFTFPIHPSIQVRFLQLQCRKHLGMSLKDFEIVGKRDFWEQGDAGPGACRAASAPRAWLKGSEWKIPVRCAGLWFNRF